MDTLITAVRWFVAVAGVAALLAALVIGALAWFLNHHREAARRHARVEARGHVASAWANGKRQT